MSSIFYVYRSPDTTATTVKKENPMYNYIKVVQTVILRRRIVFEKNAKEKNMTSLSNTLQ